MREIKITDIGEIKIGHATDIKGGTGCTVIISEAGSCAGVSILGGGPASRETQLLNPINMIQKIHAVLLSGGSAYGLDAAAGVMEYLEERGVGFNVNVGVVPIVCASSLFDLVVGDPSVRPDKQMGYQACMNASNGEIEQGCVGAGTGATVGKYLGPSRMMKSGIGTYAVQIGDVKCGAIVAVNAIGDVVDENGNIIAGLLTPEQDALDSTVNEIFNTMGEHHDVFETTTNTTLGCIITNVKLNKCEANKVAQVAHNGYARAIEPVHTSADGDSIYAMSVGEIEASCDSISTLASVVMAQAVRNAVLNATAMYGLKTANDFK